MKVIFLISLLLLSLPCYALDLMTVSDSVIENCNTWEDKVLALQEYAHKSLKPEGDVWEVNGMSVEERLEKGVGWCNHQVDLFMQLARHQNIKTRMLFLLTKDMHQSPHTIGEAWDGERWVIIDPAWNLILRNRRGNLATRQDIADDFSILKEGVKEIAKTYPPYNDDEHLRMYVYPSYLVKTLEP